MLYIVTVIIQVDAIYNAIVQDNQSCITINYIQL